MQSSLSIIPPKLSLSLSLSLSFVAMENRFKLRFSRMFRGSFGSCRPRTMLSDVMEKPVFIAPDHDDDHHRSSRIMAEPSSPHSKPPRPFPSMCRPRCPERREMIGNSEGKPLPRRKMSERYPVFGCGGAGGRKCPPASPAPPPPPPLNAFYDIRDQRRSKKKTKGPPVVKKKKKKIQSRGRGRGRRRDINYGFSSSSADTNGGFAGGWSSSEDERGDETETLFSSRTLSSDSSQSQKRRARRRNRRGRGGDVLPLEGKVKDSFAVVKKSSDPYSDFRTSMVEMIVEKQIFAAKDLEQLLQCFLSLNSSHHHRIIIEVFTEIWEALFSDWS